MSIEEITENQEVETTESEDTSTTDAMEEK